MIFSILIFLLSFSAHAASKGGIPVKTLLIQAINFTIFFGLLVYFLKNPIRDFFTKRREDFLDLEKKAKELETQKQNEYEFHKQKLEDMKQQEHTVAKQATREGERYRQKKSKELAELKTRLQREKSLFVRLEEQKARQVMLKKLKDSIVKGAKEKLKTESLSKSFHKKIQKDFLKRIEGKL